MNGTNGHHHAGPIRIGGCSGAVTDRRQALAEMSASDAVDVIAGDWMSEVGLQSLDVLRFGLPPCYTNMHVLLISII